MTSTTQTMSYCFFSLSFGLLISVIVLVVRIRQGKKRIHDLPDAFRSDAAHMTCSLAFFVITYWVRSASDYWVVPQLTTFYQTCTLDDEPTYCVKEWFLLYYLYSNLIFDFAPLLIIMYFHHKAFSMDQRRQSEIASSSAVENGSPQSNNLLAH